MAQAYNVPIASGGGWPHHNMHLIAGVANGWRAEFHVPMWVTGEMIFRDPPKPSRGKITLTDQPGLGLTPHEAARKETREAGKGAKDWQKYLLGPHSEIRTEHNKS